MAPNEKFRPRQVMAPYRTSDLPDLPGISHSLHGGFLAPGAV